MIYDHITNLGLYKGLHPNLDTLLDYFATEDLSQLSLGTCQVDDEKVFLLIQENNLDDSDEDRFEYHKHYLDCHLILEGEERIRYGCGERKEIASFNEDSDIGFIGCQKSYDFDLVDGYVAIFFPGEAHRPNLFKQNLKAVKKCVGKVRID